MLCPFDVGVWCLERGRVVIACSGVVSFGFGLECVRVCDLAIDFLALWSTGNQCNIHVRDHDLHSRIESARKRIKKRLRYIAFSGPSPVLSMCND